MAAVPVYNTFPRGIKLPKITESNLAGGSPKRASFNEPEPCGEAG